MTLGRMIALLLLWASSAASVDLPNKTTGSGGKLEPNWSVFDVDELPHIQESIRLVRSIPVQYFWDFHKGQFKFGILGESVEHLYPHLVTNSKRKFSIDSPTYNVTSANTDVIFAHWVLVVQHLAIQLSGSISSTVQELLAEHDNFALKIIRIANETGIEWRTANEIRTSREVIQIKKQIVDAEMLRALARDGYRNDTFHFYHAKKMELLQAQHQHILEAIVASHGRQDEVEAKKQLELLELSEVTESRRRETQISILQHAHASAIDRLAVEVELGIKAINFRATEEGRVDRENEDVALNIMRAKGESLRKGFEEIVTLLHVKASMLLHDAFENPALVFKYVLIIAAALSLYIVLQEAAQAFRSYLTSKISTPRVLKQASSSSKSSPAAGPPEHLVLSAESSSRLDSVSHVLEVVQRSRRAGTGSAAPLLLPNVLIVGPPGTGKSMSARALAERSGFPYVVVCGGDLLAVGGGSSSSFGADSASSSAPGRYLREILHGASRVNGGRGFLVILDEVETIITDRGKRKDRLEQQLLDVDGGGTASSVSLESRECIHILLSTLRLNSVALGVIITTSLKLQLVDPALLDRMDRVVSLQLPDASLRLTHIVRLSKDQLAAYMDDSSRNQLASLCAIGIISLPTCNESAFAEAVGCVLGGDVDVAAALKGCSKESDTKKPSQTPVKRKGGRSKKVAASASASSSVPASDEDKAVDKAGGSDSGKETQQSSISTSPIRFNLLQCLFHTVQRSEGWSHRELAKLVQNIQSEVVATEECELTTEDWIRQVDYKAASKGMPCATSSS